MTYQRRIIRTAAQIQEVASAWQDLVRSSGHALNDMAWHSNAACYVHRPTDELRIMTVWEGERLMGLAPLVLSHTPRGERYEIIGSRVLYEPAEIMVRDAQSAAAMAEEIARLDRPVVLARLPAAGAFIDAFRSRARRTGLILSPSSSGSSYVDLSVGWDAYYARLSSKTRDILRRGQKQLGKLGRVELDFIRPDSEGAQSVLLQAFEVELQSWKSRARSAVLQREDLREFFLHYGGQAAGNGELLVSLLRFDGAPIAMQVASVSRGTYWLLKIGYDERHSKYRPGLQLLLETIRWSFEQKLTTYEFLGTNEPWIREWTDQERRHATLLFYPFNARGLGGLVRDSFERVRHRLPSMRRPTA